MYLVSGNSYFSKHPTTPATKVLSDVFKVESSELNVHEKKCNQYSDQIICNSELSRNLFKKIEWDFYKPENFDMMSDPAMNKEALVNE